MRRALYALFSFSLSAAAAADTYFVTNNADAGPGSLRQAIQDANSHAGPDSIEFNMSASSAENGINANGPYVITSPVTIDASTQGFLPLLVAFNGFDDGFVFDTGSDGSIVRHLQIAGVLGFERAAIRIAGASNVTVAGNVIGAPTDVGITNRLGIAISTSFNVIGGVTAADRNIIGGNVVGIQFENGASDNRVEGNYIGLDPDGKTRRANTEAGIVIANGTNNIIGGNSDESRNVIAASPAGITMFKPSTTNFILRNYIGVTAFGEASPDVKNAQGIILGGLGDNLVARNLISNNGIGIVVVEGFNQIIQANHIGTDSDGQRAIPNGTGIAVLNITDVRDLRIGGAGVGEGNHIGGNTDDGILVESNSVIRIEGNLIGVNTVGEGAVPNGTGVRLIASENTIVGGPIASVRNVISGNRGDGVVANRGVITSNLIGVAQNGSRPIPNGNNGITAVGDGSVQIGQPGAGNLIAFNGGSGIDIGGNANVAARTVEYNSILNNFRDGVRVRDNARHTIRRNSIGRNGGLGIDLAGDNVTVNDPGDGDSGPNQRQNYPVLTGFSATTTQLSVRGTLNSAANATYTLDFYTNLEPDPSGFGEGETYVGTTTVTTNAFGDATFTAVLPSPNTPLRYMTATATDAAGNTSEFSRALFLGPSAGPPKRRSARH